jgi:predicted GNAT family N-acyltransferase
MNEQSQFLRTIIKNAKYGNEHALQLLRDVCRTAADQAPERDLILMAEQLQHFHSEALRRQAEAN